MANSTIGHKFKMQDSFQVAPNTNHDLLSKLILLRNGWRSLTYWDPTLASIVIDPLLVSCHNSLPKTVIQRIVEQLAADFDLFGGLRFGQLVWILSWLFVDIVKLLEMIPNCLLIDTKFFSQFRLLTGLLRHPVF